MVTRDYNGPAEWSAAAIVERYERYALRMRQRSRMGMLPRWHAEGDVTWVYPVMDNVIAGVKANDRACTEIVIEFVESDHKQLFGRILHSNAARALRAVKLSPAQTRRLRKRILDMLVAGKVPHEYQEYARLLRKIGLGMAWPRVRKQVNESNSYVMRYVRYFERHAGADPAG